MFIFSTFICFINKNSTKKTGELSKKTQALKYEKTPERAGHTKTEWQEPPLQHSLTYCFTNVYIQNYHVLNNAHSTDEKVTKAGIHHKGFLTLIQFHFQACNWMITDSFHLVQYKSADHFL